MIVNFKEIKEIKAEQAAKWRSKLFFYNYACTGIQKPNKPANQNVKTVFTLAKEPLVSHRCPTEIIKTSIQKTFSDCLFLFI